MKIFRTHIFIFLILILYISILHFSGIGCSIRYTTGINCPTCGVTRSIIYLLTGRIADSIHLYPMSIPLVAAIFFGIHKKLFPKHKNILNICVVFIGIMLFLIFLSIIYWRYLKRVKI